MNIVTLELLAGPVPRSGETKDHARYGLRRVRAMDLHQQATKARYIRAARRSGLSNREIGDLMGRTEGWVRQYMKDIAGKHDQWDFADDTMRPMTEAHDQFYRDMVDARDMDQKLHLCASYGLSDGAVAEVLGIPFGRVGSLMEGPRAEAAA